MLRRSFDRLLPISYEQLPPLLILALTFLRLKKAFKNKTLFFPALTADNGVIPGAKHLTIRIQLKVMESFIGFISIVIGTIIALFL